MKISKILLFGLLFGTIVMGDVVAMKRKPEDDGSRPAKKIDAHDDQAAQENKAEEKEREEKVQPVAVESHEECAICVDSDDASLEMLQLPKSEAGQCGHSFHKACLLEHFARSKNCPVCRAVVDIAIFDFSDDDIAALGAKNEELRIQNNAEIEAADRAQALRLQLWDAATVGDLVLFRAVLAQGVSINEQDGNGNAALHFAVLAGNFNIALQAMMPCFINGVLSFKADINLQNHDGDTPLHLAAKKDLRTIADMLHRAGADMTIRNNKGDTPGHIVARNSCDPQLQKLLITPLNVNIKNNDGDALLHIIVCVGDWIDDKFHCDLVRQAMAVGGDINMKDRNGDLPGHCALYVDNAYLLDLLVNENNVNVQGCNGKTLLHLACELNEIDIIVKVVTRLLALGADSSIRDNDGKLPVDSARNFDLTEVVSILS